MGIPYVAAGRWLDLHELSLRKDVRLSVYSHPVAFDEVLRQCSQDLRGGLTLGHDLEVGGFLRYPRWPGNTVQRIREVVKGAGVVAVAGVTFV